MKGIPIELIFVLLFGAALVFNFLMQRAARRQQVEAAHDEPAREEEEIPEEVWRGPSAAGLPPAGPFAAPPRRAAPAPAMPAARAQRRFARQALLGTRRQVQDAFVVATILGRCRGDEPHDIR
jgi:hypothetical protein